MNSFEDKWQRLTAAARLAPDTRDDAAPYGFATRVASQAMTAEPQSIFASLERFSWRALGLAGVLTAASFAVNYSAITSYAEEELGTTDAVAEVLNLS